MPDCGKTMAKRVNLQVAKFPLRELQSDLNVEPDVEVELRSY
jgi:hypothetical protein